MTIKLQLPRVTELKPRIVVIGVGGAGGNAINNMIASGLTGVEFVAANTDAQALMCSSAERRIQLGASLTEGLGAGSKPEIGEAAAEEAIEEIKSHIAGAHMVFVAAGMGGGTGTGAAAVMARVARELDILVVGIVTKPFLFEGARRMRAAEAGIAELKRYVDTLIVIPNQNIFRIANERTTFAEAFVLADQILYSGIACIVDLIVKEGLINLDFADVRTIMRDMGTAMMGTGEATGENRAILAAEEAISNPLLDEISLRGARGLLVSIIGGHDMTLFEVDAAANRVREEVDPEANIIIGASFDASMGDRLRVAIVASGMQRENEVQSAPRADRAAAPQAAGVAPTRAMPLPPGALPPDALQPPPVPGAASAPMRPLSPGMLNQRQPARNTQTAQGQPQAPQWQAAGDIVIEEGLPPLAPAPVPARHGAGGPSFEFTHDPMPPPVPFVPAAPAEIRRPANRMPALEEFPPLAQKEYRARAAGGGDSQPSQPVTEPARRGGLLQRLVARTRRQGDAGAEDRRESAADFFDRKRG